MKSNNSHSLDIQIYYKWHSYKIISQPKRHHITIHRHSLFPQSSIRCLFGAPPFPIWHHSFIDTWRGFLSMSEPPKRPQLSCIKKLIIGSALWIQIALVCVIVYICSSRTCVSLKPEAWSLKPLSFSSDTPAFVSCVTQAQLPASTSTINSLKFILIRPGLSICFCFLIEN